MKKKNIILFGAGGHALSLIDVIESTNKFKILFLVDKFAGKIGKYKVVKQVSNLNFYKKYAKNIIISVGYIKNPQTRKILFSSLKKHNYLFPVIISPISYVSKSVLVGEGTVIMHHVIINSKSKIGKNCIINTKCLIEHGVKIDDNCHISTGSIINGDCQVGANTFVGSGSVLIQGIKLNKNSFVRAGEVVR